MDSSNSGNDNGSPVEVKVQTPVMDVVQPPKPAPENNDMNLSEASISDTEAASAPEVMPAPSEINVDETDQQTSAEAPSDDGGSTDMTPPSSEESAAQPAPKPPKKKKHFGMILVVLLVVGAIAAGAVYYYLQTQKKSQPALQATTNTTTQTSQANSKVTGSDIDSLSTNIDKDLQTASTNDPTSTSNLTDTTLGL